MAFSFNDEITKLFKNFRVPVKYMYYDGNANTYVTFMQSHKDNTLAGDDTILGYVLYYDFDIYSKGNYLDIIDSIIEIMQGAGWTYQPLNDGPDLYETETKYFHKTICFAKESEV